MRRGSDGFGSMHDMPQPNYEVPRPSKKPKLAPMPFADGSSFIVPGEKDKYKEKYDKLRIKVNQVVNEVEDMSELLKKSKNRIEKLETERK
jgi:hypothetical protein